MIETTRLILRPWRENDAEALYRYASDAEVSRMALWPRHTSVEMSRRVINEFFIPNPYTFAIALKESDEAIGCIGLVPEGEDHYEPLPGEREVGYWVGHPLWGNGITTEALMALVGYCRDRLHLPSLLITTDSRNRASQRVAEKCGFKLIGDYSYGSIPSKAYRLNCRDARPVRPL